MIAFVFYVPTTHAEAVKEAVFAAGAGRIGNYEACAWQVEGTGQFRPLAGSQPTIGRQDQLERVPEVRVEMVCEEARLAEVVAALREAHPYEEPAFHHWRVDALD